MRKLLMIFMCLLFVGAVSAVSGKPISIMTYHYGKPGVAAHMSGLLDNALACAEVRSIDDIAAVLKNLHDQLLLGADVPDDRPTSPAGDLVQTTWSHRA